MTRVLMVSSLWPPAVIGGAELYASRLSEELRARGHEVAALTLGVDGDDVVGRVRPWPYRLDEWTTQPRWKRALFHGTDLYRPATRRAVRAAIARFRPDVVHTHAVQGLSTSALVAPRSSGTPHVHSLHDYWLLCQRTTLRTRSGRRCGRASTCGLVSALRRAAIARSGPDVYLAPSAAVAAHHARWPALGSRLRIVEHPADPAPPRTPTGARAGVTFGYLGQLTDIKGIPTLLAAFDAFRAGARGAPAAGGAARLLVGGTGPRKVEVEGAGNDVVPLGWVDGEARERFFAAIDCLIVPSEWDEPAGLVVAEAAARSVPVIASDIGGIPDYVAPASRPLLVPAGDVPALAAAMARVAADPAAWAGSNAHHLPTWDEHIGEVMDVYDSARAASAARAGGSA